MKILETERVLLKKDESKFEQYRQSVLQAKGLIQNAVTAYNSLDLPEVSIERLFELASTPDGFERFVREHLYNLSTAKDLPLTKEAVLPMLELPIGFRSAQTALSTLRNNMEGHALKGWFPVFDPRLYTIENGAVTIDEQALESELEASCCEHLTGVHAEAYRDAKQILDLLNAFSNRYGQRLIGDSGSAGIITPAAYGPGIIFEPSKIRHIPTLQKAA